VYFAYFALALLFAIAVTNRVRDAIDRFDELLHGAGRARVPFELLEVDLSATYLQPEARAAGLKEGDRISSIGTRPVRGSTDYYSLLRNARPGDRLIVHIQSSGSTRKNISIELHSFFPRGPKISDWFSFHRPGTRDSILLPDARLLGSSRAHTRYTCLVIAVADAQFPGIRLQPVLDLVRERRSGRGHI
jgi:hypothetical protein